ncbi:MAG TPA: hypothetical protein VF265_06200 [Nevskiaceae bacterium]
MKKPWPRIPVPLCIALDAGVLSATAQAAPKVMYPLTEENARIFGTQGDRCTNGLLFACAAPAQEKAP